MIHAHLGPTAYPANFALALDDGGQMVVFSSDSDVAAIGGREVFRFDRYGQVLWQINPERGTTESREHEFDRELATIEPFVNVWDANGDFYASRFNGDTFRIDMDTGEATYSGWART